MPRRLPDRRARPERFGFLPETRIDVVVDDAVADAAVDAILAGATTGKLGDGTIWVTEAERVVRIDTGEEGVEALV